MLYVEVDDAAAWYEKVRGVVGSGDFPGTRVEPPRKEEYGALVTYAWDPVGVLLHFAQTIEEGTS